MPENQFSSPFQTLLIPLFRPSSNLPPLPAEKPFIMPSQSPANHLPIPEKSGSLLFRLFSPAVICCHAHWMPAFKDPISRTLAVKSLMKSASGFTQPLRRCTTLLSTLPSPVKKSVKALLEVSAFAARLMPLPMVASTSKMRPPPGASTPRACPTASPMFLKISIPAFTTEKTPLNTSRIFPAVSSLTLNRSVSSRTFTVNSFSLSPVSGGKISLKASFTECTMSIKLWKVFFIASIKFSRPDSSPKALAYSATSMVPSFSFCCSSLAWSIWAWVMPISSFSSLERPSYLLTSLSTDAASKSLVIHPF